MPRYAFRKMAQLSRVRVNLRSLLDNNKFRGQLTKYFSSGRNKKTSVTNQHAKSKEEEFTNENGPSGSANNMSFYEKLIEKYKKQGRKSILVQVHKKESVVNLKNYCEQFGPIAHIYHYYQEHTKKNFALVEFQHIDSKFQALSCGVFERDNSLPVQSSCFWFREDRKFRYSQSFQDTMHGSCEISHIVLEEQALLNNFSVKNIHQEEMTLSNQLMRLYNVFSLSTEARKLRFHVISNIENRLSMIIHGLTVYPFGSSVNEFGKQGCDLDLLCGIEIDNNTVNQPLVFHTKTIDLSQSNQKRDLMISMANYMAYFVPGLNNVQKIMGARIPIIKFHDVYTNVQCDLSITNRVAFYMAELLYLYGKIDNRVRPLVFCIRKWAEVNDVTSIYPGPWITNFSLSILVLFFLQKKHILPTLQQLREWARTEDIRIVDNNIDCTFLREPKDILKKFTQGYKNCSLADLLYEFFNFYMKLDYHTVGICIRKGRLIPKPDVSPLFIQNPFENYLNISKNVSTGKVEHFKAQMDVALYLLEHYNDKKKKTFQTLFGVFDNSTVLSSDKSININKIYGMRDNNVSENKTVNRLNDRTKDLKMQNLVKQ